MEHASYDDTDVTSILGFAQRLEGRTLRDALSPEQHRSWSASTGKGDFGLAVEHYFDIARNAESGPDFPKAGLELKATGLRLDREGLTAKERVSITMIDYDRVAEEEFDGSALDRKTRRVLFVFYRWEAGQDVLDADILRVGVWERDAATTSLARACHRYVRERIRQREAHLLTSKHTAGFEAATKGAGGHRRTPALGGPPARPRAFAYKRDFVHHLWLQLAPGTAKTDRDPASTFRHWLRDRMLAFEGWTAAEINERLGLGASMKPKHAHRLVAERLIAWLRDEEREEDARPLGGMEQLEAMGITPRVIRVDDDWVPDQTPPLGAFSFEYLAETEFEDSYVREATEEVMFIVWSRTDRIPDSRLLDVVFWLPSDEDREAMRRDYESARTAVLASDPGSLPGQRSAEILHVRTSGQDSSDVVPLPNGELATRRGFYVNKDRAANILAESRAKWSSGG